MHLHKRELRLILRALKGMEVALTDNAYWWPRDTWRRYERAVKLVKGKLGKRRS